MPSLRALQLQLQQTSLDLLAHLQNPSKPLPTHQLQSLSALLAPFSNASTTFPFGWALQHRKHNLGYAWKPVHVTFVIGASPRIVMERPRQTLPMSVSRQRPSIMSLLYDLPLTQIRVTYIGEDFSDFRVALDVDDPDGEAVWLKFESFTRAFNFVELCNSSLERDQPRPSPPKPKPKPSEDEGDAAVDQAVEDLLGMSGEFEEDDSSGEEGTKAGPSNGGEDVQTLPLKELVKLARAMNIDITRILERRNLEDEIIRRRAHGQPRSTPQPAPPPPPPPTPTNHPSPPNLFPTPPQQRFYQQRAALEAAQRASQQRAFAAQQQAKQRAQQQAEWQRRAQQRQPAPPPAPPPTPARSPPSGPDPSQAYSVILAHLKRAWMLPPKALPQLLLSLQTTFPPLAIDAMFNHRKFILVIPSHPYFGRFAQLLPSKLHTPKDLRASLKRTRFFLHPDKAPVNFSHEQRVLARVLWDVISESEETYFKDGEELNWVNE